jgi:hypothetical protein
MKKPIKFMLQLVPGYAANAVRGYKVKVTRQTLSPEGVAERRNVVAEVIARSISSVEK